jgi:hypothetical protein
MGDGIKGSSDSIERRPSFIIVDWISKKNKKKTKYKKIETKAAETPAKN